MFKLESESRKNSLLLLGDEPFCSNRPSADWMSSTHIVEHQLRVHLNEISHPILGDRFYGKTNTDKASRLCLHAFSLEFNHPLTKERMKFNSHPEFLCSK